MGNLQRAGHLVADLTSSVHNAGQDLGIIPVLVVKVVNEGAWQEFVTERGEPVSHERFEQFVEAKPLKGLGSTVRQLQHMCRDSQEALDAIDKAVQNPVGTNQHEGDDNIHTPRPAGTSGSAALRRLRKDRPDLHEQVLAEKLSAHAAMVQAGFRPRTVTVRTDRPDSIARTLRKALTDNQLAELVRLLGDLA